MESLVGKTLGQYRLERLLAGGSQSGVYQARDERLERLVAIKVATRPGALDHFRVEARLTGSLDHPNILPIYDFGAQEGIAYLVGHYAAGGSLEDRLRAANHTNGLPLEEVAYYLDQAAAALDYTHTRGIVHGKLKPSNLLLRERWLMLGDFGAAQRLGNSSQASRSAAGSRSAYSAPELRGSAPTGPAADRYALGITVYRLLWGSLPRLDSAGRWIDSPPPGAKPLPAPAGLTPRLAAEIEMLLRRAAAPHPEDRPRTAGALAAEFRALIATPGAQSAPAEIPLICPTCGFLNKPQARFCRSDGTRLPVICPRCGAENRSDAKFCQSDGTELARICPTCGAVNPRQASVCQHDQTPLARVCPVCGFENPLRARYCERDGAQLK
ncbi:MAG TPA: serine/threonine-protein kinase [Ktedonobacterales bacterium]